MAAYTNNTDPISFYMLLSKSVRGLKSGRWRACWSFWCAWCALEVARCAETLPDRVAEAHGLADQIWPFQCPPKSSTAAGRRGLGLILFPSGKTKHNPAPPAARECALVRSTLAAGELLTSLEG